jgi:dTDP-4-dehydrorhamnose 3,5-epimerase
MNRLPTNLAGVDILEPRVFGDNRGFFLESWNAETFKAIGLDYNFMQDNHSFSKQGTLRGLHYQLKSPQGKLVRVTHGRVFDVAVDIRKSSSQFGQWIGVELSDENKRMLWIPPGFAHGFYVLSDRADFQYKCTTVYNPADDRGISWNDPAIGIDWPLVTGAAPDLSAKDAIAPLLADAEVFE